MSPKSVNCFLFLCFLTGPQFVVSHPNAMIQNHLEPKISGVEGSRSLAPISVDDEKMSGFLQPVEATPILPQVVEGTNSLATPSDFNPHHTKDTICMDNFYIMPRGDGYPGSRAIATIPEDSFRGNLVAIRCLWPIAVAWDAAVEISIRSQQSDCRLPCTVWNLTFEYGFDPEKPLTIKTVVCPSEKRTILKIPPEAEKVVLILTGLLSRTSD